MTKLYDLARAVDTYTSKNVEIDTYMLPQNMII